MWALSCGVLLPHQPLQEKPQLPPGPQALSLTCCHRIPRGGAVEESALLSLWLRAGG